MGLNFSGRHYPSDYNYDGSALWLCFMVLSQTQIVGSKLKRHFSSDTIM